MTAAIEVRIDYMGFAQFAGILTDDKRTHFIHAQAHKQGRRYRYYVEKLSKPGQVGPADEPRPSGATGIGFQGDGAIAGAKRPRPKRIPALEIEAVVRHAINELISDPSRLLDVLDITRADDVARALDAAAHLHARLRDADPSSWDRAMAAVLDQVIWRSEELIVRFNRAAFLALLGVNANGEGPGDLDKNGSISEVGSGREEATPDACTPEINIPIRVRTRGVEMKLVLPGATADIPRNPDLALT